VSYLKFLEGSPVEPVYLDAERHARDAKRGLWNESISGLFTRQTTP
jgi:endonuclease YncB( thermonuclease family)